MMVIQTLQDNDLFMHFHFVDYEQNEVIISKIWMQ